MTMMSGVLPVIGHMHHIVIIVIIVIASIASYVISWIGPWAWEDGAMGDS